MNKPVSFQSVIEYVEQLSEEEQNLLIDLIQKRRIEKRRMEIAKNAIETLTALRIGTAKRGKFAKLKVDLLLEEDEC